MQVSPQSQLSLLRVWLQNHPWTATNVFRAFPIPFLSGVRLEHKTLMKEKSLKDLLNSHPSP